MNRPGDNTEPSDEALMAEFAESVRESAFDEIMKRYYARGVAYARGRVFDHAAAEDLVQETFVRIVRLRRRFDPTSSFSGWFFTILRNRCIDYIRKIRRRSDRLSELTDCWIIENLPEPDPPIEVETLLGLLNDTDRDVLRGRFVRGLTFRELAEERGESMEKLKKQTQRALKKIRKKVSLPRGGKRIDG